MKNKNIKLSAEGIKSSLLAVVGAIRRYASVLLFLLFTFVYGYMIYQINTLSNPTVDQNEVLSQAKKLPTPRIDEEAAKKLESLKDNSVNVQTLFEQGRTNPFQE